LNQEPILNCLLLYSKKKQGIEIWTKPVLPKSGQRYSWAIVVLNRRVDGTPSQVTVPLRELGLDSSDGYHVRELNEHKDVGIISPDQAIQVDVNPSGKKRKKLDHRLTVTRKIENSKSLFLTLTGCRCRHAEVHHHTSAPFHSLMGLRCKKTLQHQKKATFSIVYKKKNK
jgi:hypothetical protein